jgi:hypothetical protein
MGTSKGVRSLQEQYRRLKEGVVQIGLIALGTITPRTITRRNPEDKRRKKTYGPYYQWTYKLQGKTVTVNLTKDQAVEFRKAVDNQRRLEGILSKMLELSRTILQNTTVGVRRRLRAPDRRLNLNFVPFVTVPLSLTSRPGPRDGR